jgi:hypothetical protein
VARKKSNGADAGDGVPLANEGTEEPETEPAA